MMDRHVQDFKTYEFDKNIQSWKIDTETDAKIRFTPVTGSVECNLTDPLEININDKNPFRNVGNTFIIRYSNTSLF